MKVIDLINKKYNNEEMPKHILINKMNYIYDDHTKTYKDEYRECMSCDFTNDVFNMPVEIIEDNNIDIDIDSIEEFIIPENISERIVNEVNIIKIFEKQNKLIQTVKQLNREIKELKKIKN